MIRINAQVFRDVDQWLRRTEDKTEQAMVRAVNATALKSRSQWSRLIRAQYRLTAASTRDRLSMVRARRGRIVADIRPRRNALRAEEFKPRVRRDGVTVRFRKSGPTLLAGAFGATTASGKEAIYAHGGAIPLPGGRRRRRRKPLDRRGARRRVKTGSSRGKYYRPSLPIDQITLAYFNDLANPHARNVQRFSDGELPRQFEAAFRRAGLS